MTKIVNYRGGIVSFPIPKTWREEYEPEGGGTFYDDRPDSGTLRLNVLSFNSKDVPACEMAASAFPSGGYELLNGGFPVRRYVSEAEEDGESLRIHRWEVAVPVPPRSLRLVLFAHTVLASQENAASTQAELSFIENSVCQAVFSQSAGVVGDDCQPE